MHRIFRIAVSVFLMATSFFLVTVMRDQGLITAGGQIGAFAVAFLTVGGLRAVMYGFDSRHGFEHEVQTKDTVTGEALLFIGGLMYAWLILGVLVGTGSVSLEYEDTIKPFLGWASLIVVALTALLYGVGMFRLRRGEISLGGRTARERRDEAARDLAHHGRA
ncbi:hypothetical protein [Curtobacterium sp. S6]|uniref:hypothetical protein n=1 Tax=Curtobacterium sp. S6 TaxID=1479623 RepID=UPI0004AA7929|nr:hypothetical protein [Curtobacterium sp. S6]